VSAFAGVLAFAGFTAWTPAPLQDFQACIGATEGGAGTMESVREATQQRDLHAVDEKALTHSVREKSGL